MSNNIIESYSWMAPQWKVADQSPKKIRIKGQALFAFEKFFKKGVSGNQRKYIQDELQRSARTLQNVPIDVNHEISLWEEATGHNWNTYKGKKPKAKGHVMWGEEEGGIIEYVAEVNDSVYMPKVVDTWAVKNKSMTVDEYQAKWGKLPLEGVSVDADFLHLRCQKCKDDKLYFDLNEYKNHMWDVHFIKNFEIEPRGINFKRLSLVEPPEKPGVEGAGFELVETVVGMHKLYEALLIEAEAYYSPSVEEGNPYQSYIPEKGLTQNKEITEMKEKEKTEILRYTVSPDTKVAFDPRADYDFTVKEQDSLVDTEEDIKKRLETTLAKRRELQQEQTERDAEYWDAINVLDVEVNALETALQSLIQAEVAVTMLEPDVAMEQIQQTKAFIVEMRKIKEQDEHQCEEGSHWDKEAEKCVPDEAPSVEEQEDHGCEEGTHWSEEKNKCVPNEAPAVEEQEHICPDDFHWDPTLENCVADAPPADVVGPSMAEFIRATERIAVLEKRLKQKDSLAEKQAKEKQLFEAKQRDDLQKEEIKKLQEANKQLGFKVAHVDAAVKVIPVLKKDAATLRGQIMGLGTIQKGIIGVVESLQERQPHTHPEFSEWTTTAKTLSNRITIGQDVTNNFVKNISKTVTELHSKLDTTTSELNTKITEHITTATPPSPALTEMLTTDLPTRVTNVEQYIKDQRATTTGKFKGNPSPNKSTEYENPDNPYTK